MKQIKSKRLYVSPAIEVIEMENEGVIAGSPANSNISDYTNGGSVFGGNAASGYSSSSPTKNVYSNSLFMNIEIMLNDLLTIED